MSAGRILTLGLGTPFSNVGFLVTLGLGTEAVPPTPTPTVTPSGGFGYEGRQRSEEDIKRDRIRFGVLPMPEAEKEVARAVVARERVGTDPLQSAYAQLDAERIYRETYLKVYGDMIRDHLEAMWLEDLKKAQRRRRATLLLLLGG